MVIHVCTHGIRQQVLGPPVQVQVQIPKPQVRVQVQVPSTTCLPWQFWFAGTSSEWSGQVRL